MREERPLKPVQIGLNLVDGASTRFRHRIGDIQNPRSFKTIRGVNVGTTTDDVYGVFVRIVAAIEPGGITLEEGYLAQTSPAGGGARKVQRDVHFIGPFDLFGENIAIDINVYNFSGKTIDLDGNIHLSEIRIT